jgi:TRAP-type mannitol/chloroaromatic compound transport system substrate-binding protein
MKRRDFIKAAAVGSGGAALAAPAIVHAQESVRWRLASSFPKSLDTLYAGAEVVAKRVAEATSGKFEIKVFAAGEIVPGLQVADAVQQGTVQACHTVSNYFFGKDPTFALDGIIPFGMSSRQLTAWMYQGGGMQVMRDFFREYNLVNFPCGNTGAQMAGWFRKEIKTPADIKGMKMRIAGLGGVVWDRLGGVPQQLAGGDIYPALERGTIDAAEFVGPYDDEKLGFHKVAKYYYSPSFWEGCAQITLHVNSKAWEALPKDYQAIFTAACAEAHSDMQAKYDARNPAALRRLIAGGAQVRAIPKPVLDAAWKASNEIYAEYSAKHPTWKKAYGEYSKFRDETIRWFRFAEYGYDNFMASITK